MAHCIIIGGHGKVALLTAPLLIEAGHEVTSVIRDPAQTADVEAAGAKALVLDVERASKDEFAGAFEGKQAVIWAAGAGGGDPRRTTAVDRDAAIRSMDAAEHAGAQRYVMVSYYGSRPDHGVPEGDSFHAYAEAKAAADEHLRSSGLDWTVLGPGQLTSDEPSGTIQLDAPGEETEGAHSVSRGNVARTIVAALDIDGTIGRTLRYADGGTDIREAFSRV